ncbi:MAG: hypothetical protein H6607_11045 [Flavobacteriales bacterium]|nr:hypothetical protein [Flavobacteriales bacterium]
MKYATRIVLALLVLVSILIWNGCRKDRYEPKQEDLGYSYFLMDKGNTWIYEVDSIQYTSYNQSHPIDTFQFFIKRIITDTFIDKDSAKNAIVSVYKSNSINGNYQFVRNYTQRIYDFRAEVVDTNVKTVALVFPPNLNEYWNANLFNTKDESELEIAELKLKDSMGGNSYDSILYVLRSGIDIRTLKDFGMEKYAKNVGLIYSEQIHKKWKSLLPNEIPDGFEYTYKLVKFEK